MRALSKFDKLNNLRLEDLHQENFDELFPYVDKVQANKILQAELEDGSMLYGLDANCKAWELVGKNTWFQILRWPILRNMADLAYLLFANNRSLFSYALTGKRRNDRCEDARLRQ
tara:strand:+ start:985 stop:1329 length:345 start_codon:yes stop_codon:yes gene_type:complete